MKQFTLKHRMNAVRRAAFDIGSGATKLLVADVYGAPGFRRVGPTLFGEERSVVSKLVSSAAIAGERRKKIMVENVHFYSRLSRLHNSALLQLAPRSQEH